MQKRLLPYTFSSGNARPHETDISSSEVLDKFSKRGIFRCAYLIILSFLFAFLSLLSLSFFLPFLFPLSPLSSSLAAVFLSHSDPLYSRLFLHLHRDRSLFIVWGIGALENFVYVTIKLTWSSIGLCNIPRRPNHSPPTPRPHWQLIGSQFSIAPFVLCGWRPMSPSVPPENHVISSNSPPTQPPSGEWWLTLYLPHTIIIYRLVIFPLFRLLNCKECPLTSVPSTNVCGIWAWVPVEKLWISGFSAIFLSVLLFYVQLSGSINDQANMGQRPGIAEMKHLDTKL